MKLRDRKVTKAEVKFWLNVLITLKGAGVDLHRSIEIIGNTLKNFNKKIYSVTVQKLWSDDPYINNEVIVLNSLSVAKKIADSISTRTVSILKSNLNPLRKLEKVNSEGQIGRVFNKVSKRLIYENDELSYEMENLSNSLDSLSKKEIDIVEKS